MLQRGQKSSMTEERINCLNSIDFVWSAHEYNWQTRFDELVAYKEQHGNCNVAERDEDHKQLGGWVKTQRKEYSNLMQGKKSAMTEERINKLEGIGFVWRAR